MEDRYRLLEPLGTGGMATVHKAEDQLLGRPVAIKRLLPHLAADPEAAERFRREAQAAAGLNHPGIVTVYDTGVDDQGPYIVMELVQGETLAARVAREGPLPPPEVAAIVGSAAEAVDHAHANGVIHRDIKPSNLIIDGGGRARLTDFGIAKAMEDPTMVTNTDEVVGTLAYMAPETLAGQSATPAADVYSLGAVTYQMLSGHPPFEADNIGALVTRIREEAPPPLGPGVPSDMATGVFRALAKEPGDRPDTAGAFATSLLSATTVPMDAAVSTQPMPVPVVPPAAEDPTRVYAGDTTRRRSPGGSAVPLLLSVALLLVLGLLALLAMAPGSPGPPPAAAETTTTTTTTTTIPSTTTTTVPTTTTTVATTTTLDPNSPEVISAGIYQMLDELHPSDFKPNDVRDIREQLDTILQEAGEGDQEELRDELEKAFDEVNDLPESPEREALVEEFIRLAEAYGFEVQRDGEGGGGDEGGDD